MLNSYKYLELFIAPGAFDFIESIYIYIFCISQTKTNHWLVPIISNVQISDINVKYDKSRIYTHTIVVIVQSWQPIKMPQTWFFDFSQHCVKNCFCAK